MAPLTADFNARSMRRPSAKIRSIRTPRLAFGTCFHQDSPPKNGIVDRHSPRSGARRDQPWFVRGIVVHPPRRSQRAIEVEEIAQPGLIATTKGRSAGASIDGDRGAVAMPTQPLRWR